MSSQHRFWVPEILPKGDYSWCHGHSRTLLPWAVEVSLEETPLSVPNIRAWMHLGESLALKQKQVEKWGTQDGGRCVRKWEAGRELGEESGTGEELPDLGASAQGQPRHLQAWKRAWQWKADGAKSPGFPKWPSNIFLTLSHGCLVFPFFQVTDVPLLFTFIKKPKT